MDKPQQQALSEAIRALGGQSATARCLTEITGNRVRQSNVWYWLRSSGLPPRFARPLAAVSGVSEHRLCPEVFDASTEASS